MKKHKIISPIIGVVLSIIGIVFAIISLANDKSEDKGGSIALLVIVASLGVYFILMNVFGFIAAFKKDAKSDKVASLITSILGILGNFVTPIILLLATAVLGAMFTALITGMSGGAVKPDENQVIETLIRVVLPVCVLMFILSAVSIFGLVSSIIALKGKNKILSISHPILRFLILLISAMVIGYGIAAFIAPSGSSSDGFIFIGLGLVFISYSTIYKSCEDNASMNEDNYLIPSLLKSLILFTLAFAVAVPFSFYINNFSQLEISVPLLQFSIMFGAFGFIAYLVMSLFKKIWFIHTVGPAIASLLVLIGSILLLTSGQESAINGLGIVSLLFSAFALVSSGLYVLFKKLSEN